MSKMSLKKCERQLWRLFEISTLRSRNVFLRVTDGRKYCWYSGYAWSATGCMACFAVFAHFYLDSVHSKKKFMVADQETIGNFDNERLRLQIHNLILITFQL